MASVSYDQIFSLFLGNITDYSLARNDNSTTLALMTEWLHKALSRPYLRRLFSSISIDDITSTIEFSLGTAVEDGADSDFVAYVVSKAMVVEWLEPEVKKTSLIKQNFAGKDQKFYSQASHLAEITSMLTNAKAEVRSLICDRGYIYNPYLEDE